MTYLEIVLILILAVLAWASASWYKQSSDSLKRQRELQVQIKDKDKEFSRRVYELAILKELDERIGYSLDVGKIVDIIIGSLGQFIDYSVAAYLLIDGEQLNFKVQVEKSVSHSFVKDIKKRMNASLSALLNRDISGMKMEEFTSGAILVDDIKDPVRSFFNIPLVIAGRAVGVLTVAHTKSDMYHEEDMTILYKITNDASNAVTKLQNVVQSEQQKLNAMMTSMSDGVVMTDNDYRIVVANKAARKAAGIMDDQKQVSIFDFIDHLGGSFDIRGRLEESVKMNKVIKTDDVSINNKYYDVSVLPVVREIENKSETIGSVAIFHDVTGEREAEKIREEFTSMLVHELRTPLDGVKKIIERVQSGKNISEVKKKEYFGMAHESLTEMLGLVTDILDVSKFESGKFTVNKIPGDIKSLIEEKLIFFEQSAKKAQVNLIKNIDKNVPGQVSYDHMRIDQVLNNIIGNALKFTGPGGNISVNTTIFNKGDDLTRIKKYLNLKKLTKENKSALELLPNSIVVSVSDTGVGIPESEIGTLFSRFSQARTESLRQGGSGLGLLISKNIIESHGGVVGLTSKEGEGTTFYFSIPI